jgi:hypothetical protein
MRRQRLEWLCLLCATAAIAFALAFWHTANAARTLRAEQARLDLLANVLKRELGNNLGAVNRALTGVLRDHLAPGAAPQPEQLNRRLRALQEVMPQLRGFAVIGADGLVQAAVPPDLIGRDFSARDYFIAARARPDAHTVYLSPPFVSVRGDLVVSVARAIPGHGAQVGGIISAVLDPRYFSELLSTVLYAPDVTAFVAHGNGQRLVQVPAGARSAGLARTLAIAPPGVRMDNALLIGVARDAAAVTAPLERRAMLVGLGLAMLAAAAAALLRWSQQRRAGAGRAARPCSKARRAFAC